MVAEKAHTPGPWRVRDYALDNDDAWFYLDTIEDGHGAFICHTSYTQVWGGSYVKANARLIAAAPELLAVLESLTDPEGHIWHGGNDVCTGECREVRAVIAQVYGE